MDTLSKIFLRQTPILEEPEPAPDHPPVHEQALLLQVWRMVQAGRRVEVLRDKKNGRLLAIESVMHTADEYI